MSATPNATPIPSDHLQPVFRFVRRATRFWWVGLVSWGLVAAAAVAAYLWWPRQYRSEAVLHYRDGMQWAAEEPANTRRVVIGLRLREMLLSRSQLAKVIEDLGLYPRLMGAGKLAEAVEEMRLATALRFDQSDVFVVSFTGDSPEEAQRVTARLSELLIAQDRRLRSEQAEVASEFLDEEKQRMSEELALREAEHLRFLASHPEFAQEPSAAPGVTLRATQPRGSPPPARPAPASAGAAPEPPDPLALARAAAEARVAAARRELADRQSRFTEQHPDVRTAAARLAEAEEALQRATEALAARGPIAREPSRPSPPQAPVHYPPSVRPVSGEAAKRTVALESEWARLSRAVAETRERLQFLDSRQFRASMTATMLTSGQAAQIVVIDPAFLPARPVGIGELKLLFLGLALACAAGVAFVVTFAALDDVLHDRLDVDRLALAPVLAEVPALGGGKAAGRASRARRKEHDRPAARTATAAPSRAAGAPPSDGRADPRGARAGAEPHRAPVVAARAQPPLAAVAGAAEPKAAGPQTSTALAARADPSEHVLARGDAFFTFASELSHAIRVHRLPPPTRVDERLVVLGSPDSPAAASFRVLRHKLIERGCGTTILVTSPSAHEDRTFTAANLALALGEGGMARVLLVEANLRTPSLARLFGFEPPACLAEQLGIHRTRLTAPWEVVENVAPWLHVAAVDPANDARPMLDRRAVEICLEQLCHAGYDHVVVDSPPILGSADVNLIVESVDAIVIALEARRSRARALRKAAEQIGTTRLRGSVLLGT